MPDSVNLGSPNTVSPSADSVMRIRYYSRRIRFRSALSAFGLTVASASLVALAGCASAGASKRVSTRGGADSSLAAAVAREQAGGATTSSAIGIPPFQLLTKDNALSTLGYAVADLLTTDLARSSKVTLVERSRLSDVLRELDLARSGRVDSASAPRVGKLIRAKRLVLGSVDTMSGGELRLSLRVADVETGGLEGAIDARAPLNDVLAAEKALAFRLFEALGVTLTPAERSTIEAYPTTSLAALSAYGRGVQADFMGDRRRAIDEFEKAIVVDPGFQQARDRAQQLKADAKRSAEAPSVLPGIRSINAPVNGAVDRLNRPIDILTSLSRPLGGPGDPSFPSTIVTVVITVTRP